MSIVSSQLNTDIEIDTRVRERYRQTISDLNAQGFTYFYSYSETLFPFSLLFLTPVYIAMRSYSEVTRIVTPLRVVTYYPLLRHTETGTLALLNGLNTKFHTLFTDGTVLISANSQTKLTLQRRFALLRRFEYYYDVLRRGPFLTLVWC